MSGGGFTAWVSTRTWLDILLITLTKYIVQNFIPFNKNGINQKRYPSKIAYLNEMDPNVSVTKWLRLPMLGDIFLRTFSAFFFFLLPQKPPDSPESPDSAMNIQHGGTSPPITS